MIELRKLSINDGLDLYNMFQEMPLDENGYHNSANGITYDQFKEWLIKKEQDANQVGIVDGWKVPQTTFVLYVDDTPVGVGSVRHFLTDALREVGGHIGYSISPKYRHKGYGKEILKRLIIEARKLGIKDILVTTNLDNYASQKVIIANGGKETDRSNEHVHFWIYE